MANKDGVLSIGIEYKSELNKMIADLEGGLDTISKNNQLSKGMKQQFNNVIAEVRSFKATMEKELATLGSGKVDKTAFKSFKQTVANNFKSVREDIDRLDLAVSTLNSQMEIISKGVDLSKITKEFASFEDYVNRTNEAVSQLIDTLGQQGISLFSFDNRNILDTKNKIKEIDDIINRLDNDTGAKFELFDEKEAQSELDKLSVQLKSTIELMEHTEKQMSNMDSSTVGFKKMQGDFALLQLKAASLNDTIEMLYTVTEDKGISIEMDDKSFELYDKYTEDLSDNLESIVASAKNAKKELSSLLNSQKQPSIKVSSEINPNSSELSTTITIETTSSDLWKKLSPILTDLQGILNSNPVVAPVKLVVAPNAVSSTENGDISKVSNAYSKKYAKVLAETGEDAVVDLEGIYKKTFTSVMDTAVSYAKETIGKIQEIFDKNLIGVKFEVSQEEIDKIQNFVLSNKDGKKFDISGQITKAKQEVKELNESIEKTTKLLDDTKSKGNVKFDGFDKFTQDVSKSIGKLEELQNILKALQNIEITLAKASGIASITELDNQWTNVEKRILNATKLDGSFRKNASVSKIASEYQKYIDMGGTNSIADIDKIKDNKDTLDAIISKAKEFAKQDLSNDSVKELSIELDGIIGKFDELIATVKTATNALYKIIKQTGVSELDKQWSSITNKFKSIADESGKINLSKQKKDIEELLVMYQRYVNMDGSHTPFDLTDNLETLSKLDKAYKKLNETKPIDNSHIIKSETESFKQIEQSVDSLTKAIGDTKVQAINVEATAMEDAAEREIMAIRSILDNLDLVVSRLKDIKGIKLPKIEVKNVDVVEKAVESLKKAGNKSNISSENLNSGNVDKVTNSLIEEQKAVGELDMVFRGLEGSLNGFMSNSGRLATFFTTSPLLARQYADSLGGVYQAMVALGKSLDINAEGRDWNAVEYLGDGSDEASRKIIELRKQIDNLYEQLNASGVSGTGLDWRVEKNRGDFSYMVQLYGDAGVEYNSYIEAVEKGNIIENQENQTVKQLMIQLYELEKAYRIISEAKDNVYGTHTTDEFAELAKVNGYDSVMFRNIKDSFDRTTNLADVGVIFDENQVASVKNVSNIIDDLVQKIDGIKTQHGLNLPINIELPKEISRLSDGNFVNNLTGEIYDDVQKAIESLKELDLQIDSISPIKDVFQGDETSKINEVAEATNNLADAENRLNIVEDKKSAQDYWQGRFKESISDITKTNEELVKMNKYYSDLEKQNEKIVSAQNKVDKANIELNKLSTREKQTVEYSNAIERYSNAVEELQNKINYLNSNGIQSQDDINELNKLQKAVDEISKSIQNMPASEKGASIAKSSTVFLKIEELRNKYKGMSKDMQKELDRLERKFVGLGNAMDTGRAIGELKQFETQLIKTGTATNTLWDAMKNKAFYNFANQLGTMVSFYDVINVIRQAGEAVIDLNTNITELAKVSEASVSQIYDDFNSYADIAKEVGGTISDTISATADWSRNGYNIPDSKELAEVAMIYKNVGDGIDIDQANEYLISTLRGFSLEAKDAMDIIDSINEVDIVASYYSNTIALCILLHTDSNYIG